MVSCRAMDQIAVERTVQRRQTALALMHATGVLTGEQMSGLSIRPRWPLLAVTAHESDVRAPSACLEWRLRQEL